MYARVSRWRKQMKQTCFIHVIVPKKYFVWLNGKIVVLNFISFRYLEPEEESSPLFIVSYPNSYILATCVL